jgi:hypothetical protein
MLFMIKCRKIVQKRILLYPFLYYSTEHDLYQRWSVQLIATTAIIDDAMGIIAFEYNRMFLSKISKGNSSATMASWPISTPKLKASTFITKLPDWALRSPKTLANPIP